MTTAAGRDAENDKPQGDPRQGANVATKLVASAAITAAGQIIGGWLTGRTTAATVPAPKGGTVGYYTNLFVNSKWFAPIIFLAIVVIAVGSLIDGFAKIYCVVTKICALAHLCAQSCTLLP